MVSSAHPYELYSPLLTHVCHGNEHAHGSDGSDDNDRHAFHRCDRFWLHLSAEVCETCRISKCGALGSVYGFIGVRYLKLTSAFLGHGQKQFVLLTGVILFSTGLLQQTFVIVACKVLQKLFVIALEFGSSYFCFFFLAFDGRPLYASFPIPRCFFQFRVCVFAGCSVCFDDENLVAVACVCAIIICCRHNHALHVVRVAQLNAILVFLCQVPCEN